MIALHPREQLRAAPLQPVAADAAKQRLPLLRQIGTEEVIAEIAHRQPRRRRMAPHWRTMQTQHCGADQIVRLPAQFPQQRARLFQIGAFADQHTVEHQHLIGAQHQRIRHRGRHLCRFQFGQRLGHRARVRTGHLKRVLHRRFIHSGRMNSKHYTGCGQQAGPRRACRCQHQPGHTDTLRSPRRFRIAAEVSSTERRETSMVGQPICSNRRRGAVTSSRTCSRSA